MRKFVVLSLALALVLGMSAGMVWADTIIFPNNTVVQAYHGAGVNDANSYLNTGNSIQSGPAGWYDVIGLSPSFQTYGGTYDTTTKMLNLYTQFGGANVTDLGATVADLFLDTNGDGTFDKAVRLSSTTSATTGDGSVFTGLTSANWHTSIYMTSSSGDIYGGKYDPAAPKDVPVQVYGTFVSTSTSVTWSQLTSTVSLGSETVPIGAWDVAINLTGLTSGEFAFLWATGTCANDTAEGKVPLPGALVLLGAGLVRLAGYARRKRSALA